MFRSVFSRPGKLDSTPFRVQNSIFFGNRQFGIESTYRHPKSRYYVGLIGVSLEKKPAFTCGNPTSLMAGFSMGREFILKGAPGYRDETWIELYFKDGPGIGIAARGYFDGEEMRTYMG